MVSGYPLWLLDPFCGTPSSAAGSIQEGIDRIRDGVADELDAS